MTTARRRSICVVTETYPPEINGVTSTLTQLVRGLRARGHVVSVVRPRQRVDPPGPPTDPWTILVAGAPLPGYDGLRIGFPAPAALRAAWRQDRPDAVYVATEGPLGWSAVKAGVALGIPTYSGFHTDFERYMRHYLARWLRLPVGVYLRRFHNACRATFVSTIQLRDELAAAGFANLRVLGRGVDSGRFAPGHRSAALRAAWGVSGDDLVVLCVGRLAPEKNVGLAIHAYRAMRGVNGSCRLVIVGDGPERPVLERANPGVIFSGFRTGDDLAAHYASADVFLFPSDTETFGNVTLEAMASGLVVVAYDYAAARAHIEHGRSGVLVERGDAPAFVNAAVAVARAPAALPAIRQGARAAIEAVAWTRVIDRFEEVLTGPNLGKENDGAERLGMAAGGVGRLHRRARGPETGGEAIAAPRPRVHADRAAHTVSVRTRTAL